ncbi:MAG: ATP-binding protein, partial [Methanoregula sp.]
TGKVISYNQRFTEIWEIPPEVIASRSDEQLLQSVFSKISNPEEFLTRVQYLYAHREEESREEIRLNDKRTLDRYSAPLIGNDGRYYGRIWYFRNITERKLAEEALRQANRQLNLLSSITRHDILNQLMALKGYLELSHEVIDNPSTLIEYIKKEEKAANTIEHQITFTKDYQNLGVAAPEWQNVNASINKALSGLPMRDVRVEVDPNNPEIFADRLFEKVFYNLIDNALRYGGADMKTIRVSSQEIDTGLRIVCEDDGVGISAEDKKRLFNRGFGKNTGLGLFLSREILAITGITITEKGIQGKGARFEITVPKGAWRMKRLDV